MKPGFGGPRSAHEREFETLLPNMIPRTPTLAGAFFGGLLTLFLNVSLSGAVYPPFPKEDLNVQRQDYWLYPDPEKASQRALGVTMAVSENTLAVACPGRFIDTGKYFPSVIEIYSREAGGWVHSATLEDPHPLPSLNSTYFGVALAISGDTLLVGAQLASSTGSGVNPPYAVAAPGLGTGAAYIYVKRGTSWVLQSYLKASNPDPGDGFAASVAIAGDYAFVTAPGEQGSGSGSNPPDDNRQESAGAVYIYSRKDGEWRFDTYLKHPHNNLFRAFGLSVAAWGDTLVVGGSGGLRLDGVQPGDGDFGNAFGGTAFVYVRDGALWRLQAHLNQPSIGPVVIHSNTVVVGGPLEGSLPPEWPNQRGGQTGTLFVYDRQGSTWSRQGILKSFVPWENAGIGFGTQISIWGDTILAGERTDPGDGTDFDPPWNLAGRGSGCANLYHRTGGVWSLPLYIKPYNNYVKSQMDQRSYGSAVALAPNHFFVAALDNNFLPPDFQQYAGAIHVYSYNGVGVPEPPRLEFAFEAAGDALVISWPASYGNVVLESCDRLLTSHWGTLDAVPVEDHGVRKVTLSIGVVDARFFRLRIAQ